MPYAIFILIILYSVALYLQNMNINTERGTRIYLYVMKDACGKYTDYSPPWTLCFDCD